MSTLLLSIGSSLFWPGHPKAKHVQDYTVRGNELVPTRSFSAALVSVHNIEGEYVVSFPKTKRCIFQRYASTDAALQDALNAVDAGVPFPPRGVVSPR